MKSLQQGVMQFPRDALAFPETRFHGRPHSLGCLPQPHLIKHVQECHCREDAEREEPPRLVKGRSDIEVQPSTGLVPNAIIVAADREKAEMPRRQAGIESLPSRSSIPPVFIDTTEHVTEQNALWNGDSQ